MYNYTEEVSNFDAKKEIILSLGVYELRGLARVLGVKSPTTKKRQELISLILDILEKNQDLSIPVQGKRGRPYKTLSSVKNILDIISNGSDSDEVDTDVLLTYEDLTVFNQEMPSYTLQSSDIFPCAGVFRKGKTFGYFVDSAMQRIVYVAHDQVVKYELETGDYLDCAVFEINNGTKAFVKKINKINGVDAEVYHSISCRDFSQVLPTIVEISGKNISLGGRNVCLTNSPLFMNDYIDKALNYFGKSKIVFLGLNVCFEDKAFVSKDRQVFSFTSSYTSRRTDGYDRIIDAINFVERLSDLNEDVFLLVNDFAYLLSVLDEYFSADEEDFSQGHNEKTIIIAKKLISLAKAKSNNRNVTNMIICSCRDAEDDFIKNELIKISNTLE